MRLPNRRGWQKAAKLLHFLVKDEIDTLVIGEALREDDGGPKKFHELHGVFSEDGSKLLDVRPGPGPKKPRPGLELG